MIIVKSKIKEFAGDCNVAGDFAEALNEVAVSLVNKAAHRCDANSRKTLQTKDVYLGKISAKESVVVKSKIKEAFDKKNAQVGFSVSGDFAEALNEVLVKAIKEAADRAEANGRKTIGPRDL